MSVKCGSLYTRSSRWARQAEAANIPMLVAHPYQFCAPCCDLTDTISVQAMTNWSASMCARASCNNFAANAPHAVSYQAASGATPQTRACLGRAGAQTTPAPVNPHMRHRAAEPHIACLCN